MPLAQASCGRGDGGSEEDEHVEPAQEAAQQAGQHGADGGHEWLQHGIDARRCRGQEGVGEVDAQHQRDAVEEGQRGRRRERQGHPADGVEEDAEAQEEGDEGRDVVLCHQAGIDEEPLQDDVGRRDAERPEDTHEEGRDDEAQRLRSGTQHEVLGPDDEGRPERQGVVTQPQPERQAQGHGDGHGQPHRDAIAHGRRPGRQQPHRRLPCSSPPYQPLPFASHCRLSHDTHPVPAVCGPQRRRVEGRTPRSGRPADAAEEPDGEATSPATWTARPR